MTIAHYAQTMNGQPGRRIRTSTLLAIISGIGVLAFLYPFLVPGLVDQSDGQGGNAGMAPYLFGLLTVLCLAVMLITVADEQNGAGRSRTVALLGVLVAMDASLRLVPSVAGATPIFLLIMLVGFVFGGPMGFQMGALTLLVSGFITGGIGPWLPFQMLASGWVGMTAGWLPHGKKRWQNVALLAAFGALWGLLFGALMNLWFWPFSAPGADADHSLYWQPGMSAAEALDHYVRFYAVTSLGFDAARAIGNVVLVALLGGPVLSLLERYRSRFTWTPWEEASVSLGSHPGVTPTADR